MGGCDGDDGVGGAAGGEATGGLILMGQLEGEGRPMDLVRA